MSIFGIGKTAAKVAEEISKNKKVKKTIGKALKANHIKKNMGKPVLEFDPNMMVGTGTAAPKMGSTLKGIVCDQFICKGIPRAVDLASSFAEDGAKGAKRTINKYSAEDKAMLQDLARRAKEFIA